jgi:hypothetical protein
LYQNPTGYDRAVRLWLVVVTCVLACKKPAPSPAKVEPPVDIFALDDSGLKLAGPIPLADGSVAMQHDEKYAALKYGVATLGSSGMVVHLSEAPLDCKAWPDHKLLTLTMWLGAGPDGRFFPGKVTSTHINGTRGFGHVALEPFELAAGAHVKGRVAFSDPRWIHNGAATTPTRAAGTFDVTLCAFAGADKAALVPPSDLSATAPLAFGIDGAPSTPKSVLLTVQYDELDALPWVSDVEAYDRAGVTCETRYDKTDVDMQVRVGLNPSDLGSDQPLRFAPDQNGQTQRESHVGWIRIEPFDPMRSKTAKGSVVAFAPRSEYSHLPPKSLAGTFEAQICRSGSKLDKPYE